MTAYGPEAKSTDVRSRVSFLRVKLTHCAHMSFVDHDPKATTTRFLDKSLRNAGIGNAHAGLGDIEAHQVSAGHQRSIIRFARLFDHIVNGKFGVVLIA